MEMKQMDLYSPRVIYLCTLHSTTVHLFIFLTYAYSLQTISFRKLSDKIENVKQKHFAISLPYTQGEKYVFRQRKFRKEHLILSTCSGGLNSADGPWLL